MRPVIDLTGHHYGEWTVLHADASGDSVPKNWICRCSCGTIRSVGRGQLRNGRSQSCGCLTARRAATAWVSDGVPRYKLSWEYVAGFFDGEGCIYFPRNVGNNRTRVTFVQTGERGRILMINIKIFLEAEGILVNRLKVHRNPKYQHLDNPLWGIAISRFDSIRKFLRRILPFVHVKKLEAQDVLRYLIIFPVLSTERKVMLSLEARKERKAKRAEQLPLLDFDPKN